MLVISSKMQWHLCVHSSSLTCFHEKCFSAAKAMVTEGLRWAPEMWPVERMTIMTARPVEAARPSKDSDPCVFWFTIAVAVPANISMKVPKNSAPTWLFGTDPSQIRHQTKMG